MVTMNKEAAPEITLDALPFYCMEWLNCGERVRLSVAGRAALLSGPRYGRIAMMPRMPLRRVAVRWDGQSSVGRYAPEFIALDL
jgi:hypothetical protein